MKFRAISATALLLCAFFFTNAEANSPLAHLSFSSVSTDYSLWNNPSLLAFNNDLNWAATWHSKTDDPSWGLGSSIQGSGWGAGYYFQKADTIQKLPRIDSWLFSLGLPVLQDKVAVGVRGSYFKNYADEGEKFNFSPGLSLRPWSWLSLGMVYNSEYTSGVVHLGATWQMGAAIKIPQTPLLLAWDYYTADWDDLATVQQSRMMLSLNFSLIQAGVAVYVDDFPNPSFRKMELALSVPIRSHWSVAMSSYYKDVYGLSVAVSAAPHSQLGISPGVVRMALGEKIAEFDHGGGLGSGILSESVYGLADLQRQFAYIAQNSHIKGVVFDFTGYSAGSAIAWEIRRGIQDLRAKGVATWAYLDEVNLPVMIAASAAEKIAMQPSARVHLRGLSFKQLYLQKVLAKIGIEVAMVKHGRWKSAPEMWTDSAMSSYARDNYQDLTQSLWSNYRDSIAKSRKFTPNRLDSVAENPILTAAAARKAGLVDTVLYFGDLSQWVRFPSYDIPTWNFITRDFRDQSWNSKRAVAVLHIDGGIVSGYSNGANLVSGANVGDLSLQETLSKLRNQPEIKALVLRINSPGGSAQAADNMWHALRKFGREMKIPIVASVGAAAASGGYYIACAADYIVAEPTSLVGSIGIYGGKVTVSGLLDKLDIASDGVQTHPSADAQSPYRAFTIQETATLQASMDDFYERFVTVVAQGRKMTYSQVDKLGEGQVFTGMAGQHNGLVDEIGGLQTAINKATALANIKKNVKLELKYYSTTASGVPKIFTQNAAQNAAQSAAATISQLTQTQIWAFCPITYEAIP